MFKELNKRNDAQVSLSLWNTLIGMVSVLAQLLVGTTSNFSFFLLIKQGAVFSLPLLYSLVGEFIMELSTSACGVSWSDLYCGTLM